MPQHPVVAHLAKNLGHAYTNITKMSCYKIVSTVPSSNLLDASKIIAHFIWQS